MQRKATAPIQPLVKLQPWSLSLRWKTCLRQNCSLGSCACREGPYPWAEHSDDDDSFFLFSLLFTFLQCSNYIPRDLQPKIRGSDACRGSNRLWTRTLDRYTSAGQPESVVSTISGPLPETTKDRTQINDTHPVPG